MLKATIKCALMREDGCVLCMLTEPCVVPNACPWVRAVAEWGRVVSGARWDLPSLTIAVSGALRAG